MATVKKALKYITITIVGLILTFILFLVGLKLFLPDNYIPNLVKGYANENLDANVNIEKIIVHHKQMAFRTNKKMKQRTPLCFLLFTVRIT